MEIKRSNCTTTPRTGLIGEIKKLAFQQEWMVNDPIKKYAKPRE